MIRNMSSNTSVNSSSLQAPLENCLFSHRSSLHFTIIFIAHILLLPLFILVLFVGFQQWRKRRAISKAMATSHTDVLTFNMVVLEIIGVLSFSFLSFNIHKYHPSMMVVGFSILSIILPGQTLFHMLASLERYLAVVHPVTYQNLRQTAVIQIRNITVVCVWLVCFGIVTVMRTFLNNLALITNIFFLFLSAIAVSVSSLSVFCVLTRPGPGNRVKVDRIRQRALNNMLVLTGTLLLKFLSNLIGTMLTEFSLELDIDTCLVWSSAIWFGLPGSVVLPLLFLLRAGKLPGCRKKSR
ncbi:uncharacterized protein LOC115059084 [Echeneis naucrates]|uniref:uncharacterized protein LOC115059084 n=1 Tax=Echeneis naucrates TaxID=173247 RepID=UPI001113D168|nr:uncharacterized protein LOC115059084 [Echeneis naucrates]